MIRTVELFCGIGGFRVAADALGFKTIWANDNSKLACKVYRAQFGDDVLHEGDINLLVDNVPSHDLLTAGFPCQPFSSAGKKLGIEDPRGTLFQSIVDVLNRTKPKNFILENVKRLLSMNDGWHFATILTALTQAGYFVEWRLLNAVDFGLPQHRERLIIVGTRLNSTPSSSVVRLVSQEDLESLKSHELMQLNCRKLWRSIRNHGAKFPTWGLATEDAFFAASPELFSERASPRMLLDIVESEVDSAFDFTDETKRRIKNSVRVNKLYNGVHILWNQGGGARMGYTVFGMKGVAPTLTASASRHYERYFVNNRFRRLTNIEYARLQGFPDNHCDEVSVYDQYALFGNAVPPPMIHWVMPRVLGKSIKLPIGVRQLDMMVANGI